MWPWEHAIVGYLVYSAFCHLYYRDSPGGLEAFTVVFASVLPDLIDKTLSWELGVFETGYALGHSVFFAVPLAIVGGAAARSWGRTRTGVALGLGYLFHLPADVVDGYVRGGILEFGILFWPVRTVGSQEGGVGLVSEFLHFFGEYRSELLAGELSAYIWVQVGMGVAALLLWLADGAPVLRECIIGCKRLVVAAVGGRTASNAPTSERK